MERTGAQILMEGLAREGVERVFGYAGATICPIADALREDPNIDYTLVRTEQNAGHMASGYARATGKTGVCIVTSGPGATNLITGVATAYMDSIPLVAITGQVPSNLLGRDIFQEVDITGAVTPFTKHCYLVKDAAQLPAVLKEAFHIASTGRPGPVLIDIPVDVQEQLVADVVFPEEVRIRGYNPSVRGNDKQIANVAAAIGVAERPVICAGGGVFLAHAEEELRQFAESTGIPVVTTMMGLSLLPTEHPLNMGMIGSHGNNTANRALAKSDLLIMIGTRVADRAIVSPDEIQKRMANIHIDVDPAEIGKNMQSTLPLVGNAKVILQQLMERGARADCGAGGPPGPPPDEPEPGLSRQGRVRLPGPPPAAFGRAAERGRRRLRGRGTKPDLGLQAPAAPGRPVFDQRGPGDHGLCPSLRRGGEDRPARAAGGGNLRRRVVPDVHERAGGGEGGRI